MRARHWLLGLAIAAAALVVALELIARAVSLEGNRPVIERRLGDALGLAVSLGGDIRLRVLPKLWIEVGDVKVANLPGRPSPHLLEIGTLELGLDVLSLLSGDISVSQLELVDVDLHLEPDEEGELGAPPEFEKLAAQERPEQLAPLQVRHVLVQNLRVFYRTEEAGVVTSAHFTKIELDEAELDAPVEVELEGEYDGGAFRVEGRMGPIAEILWPTQPYALSLRGDLLDAAVEVEGTVDAPTDLEGFDLAFALRLPDAGHRLREAGVELPVIGPLRATGRLTGSGDLLALRNLEIVSLEPDQPIRGRVSGAILNLQEVQGVKLDVTLETSDLSFFEPLVGRPLGQIDEIAIEALVSDEDGSLGVERGRLSARAGEGVASLEASGIYDDVLRKRELDVTLELRASDLAVLGRLAALERLLPPVGPVQATGRLREIDGAIGVHDLTLEIGKKGGPVLHAGGSVRDLSTPAGVQLALEFRDPDPRRFARYLDREIPDIGGIEGSSEISDSDGTLGVERFEMHAGRRGVLEATASAELDDLFAYDDIDIQIDLQARDLAVIGRLLDADLPPIGPFRFRGTVSGDNERLETSGEALLGESRFSGNGTGRFGTDARPRFEARLRSDHVRLRDIGFLPDEPEPGAVAAGPLPSDVPAGDQLLPFEQLRLFDLDLGLDLARVTGRAGFDLRNARVRVKLDDGDLRVSDFSGAYEGGELDGSLRVDARTSTPTVTFVLDATGVDLAQLDAQLEDEGEVSGVLDLALNLETQGRTLEAQLERLQGYAGAMLRDGTLATRYARRFIVNLSRVAFSRLPMGRRDPRVGCLRAESTLEEGVAEIDQIVLSGDEVSVEGRGSINLGRGRYDLTLTPSTSNPAVIGVAATVRVTGPLEEPEIRPVARSLVTSAASGALSNALRPGRAAQSSLELLRRGRRNGQEVAPAGPCDVPLPRQRP